MKKDNTINAFFALLRAGLWEKDVCLTGFGKIDYDRILLLAEEQSVVGLVAAGLEHVADVKVPKEVVLQFVGQTLQLEQNNKAMNSFIARLVNRMRKNGIYTLLLKGQGIAQCYERPLWRSCGDVDFFLSDENYLKAKEYLLPFATNIEPEGAYEKHLGMKIEQWEVELHGTLRSGLSRKIDKGLDKVRDHVFFGGEVRSWTIDGTQIFLLGANNDALYVFTHILQHFFKGGIGLRQVCDWCRVLWTYRDSLKCDELKRYLHKMGLVSEWKAFGAFAVEFLGMSCETMLLYASDKKWSRKAEKIGSFILEVGNFGHNRDMSYYRKYSNLVRKTISLSRRFGDIFNHFWIFPLESLCFFPNIILRGLRSAIRGE